VPRGDPISGERCAKHVRARRTGDVMNRHFPVLPNETGLDEFREQPENRGAVRHLVIEGERIVYVQRMNARISQGVAKLETQRPRFAAKEVCWHRPSPNMVCLPNHSTTSGDDRKSV
jgi:hypothetical protein